MGRQLLENHMVRSGPSRHLPTQWILPWGDRAGGESALPRAAGHEGISSPVLISPWGDPASL